MEACANRHRFSRRWVHRKRRLKPVLGHISNALSHGLTPLIAGAAVGATYAVACWGWLFIRTRLRSECPLPTHCGH